MRFPLGFNDVSLLIAVLSIILLITLELLTTKNSEFFFVVDKKRFKEVTYLISGLFLLFIIIRIFQLFLF